MYLIAVRQLVQNARWAIAFSPPPVLPIAEESQSLPADFAIRL
jgi:hypothetical protein